MGAVAESYLEEHREQATGLEKDSFHSNLKERQCQRMLKLPHNGTHLMTQRVKRLPAVAETWVRSLGQENPLEKEMANHSSILGWEIPWTEEPCRGPALVDPGILSGDGFGKERLIYLLI